MVEENNGGLSRTEHVRQDMDHRMGLTELPDYDTDSSSA